MLKYFALGSGTFLLLMTAPSMANKVKHINIAPISGYDQAPEFAVYSTDGENYTDVDPTESSRVSVRLSAKCKYEGRGNKAYKGVIEVPGFVRVGSKEPANFLIPHADEASAEFRWNGGTANQLNPVEACNNELAKLAATTAGKSRQHLLAEGFTVNFPAALRVVYDFRCEATGLGRTDLESRSVLANTRIKCEPSALAAENLPKDKPKPKRAKIVPLLNSATFVAEPEVHTGACPATIKFNGTLTATRAGTVRYRYTRYDGKKSPEYTLTFDKAGTKATSAWQTQYQKPNAGTTLASNAGSGTSANDFQGWYRLDILSPSPTGQIAAHYRVMCDADSNAEQLTLQAAPVERSVEVKQLEVQTLQVAPATRRKVEKSEDKQ